MKNAQKLLEKIQTENIAPLPRWHFVVRNIFFWGIGIFSIFLGTIAVSLILDVSFNTDSETISRIMNSPLERFFSMIPFLWIFIAFIFLGFAFFGMMHTKKGYKYNSLLLWGASMAVSIILGSGIYAMGYAEKIEIAIAQNIALYHGVNERRQHNWSHPEKGLLSGEIQEISTSEKTLLIEDWNNNLWEVDYSRFKNTANQKKIPLKNLLTIGKIIRIHGSLVDESGKKFSAEDIRPWGREYHMLRKNTHNISPEKKESMRENFQKKFPPFHEKSGESEEPVHFNGPNPSLDFSQYPRYIPESE